MAGITWTCPLRSDGRNDTETESTWEGVNTLAAVNVSAGQNVDEYKPTTNERKLIEALCNPENRKLNVTELCKVVGISREAYYRMFRKPQFVEYYKRVQFEAVKQNAAKVLAASIEYAINDPKCHQDRKMILEMAGLYTEKVKQEITGEGGGPIGVTVIFSDKMRPPGDA